MEEALLYSGLVLPELNAKSLVMGRTIGLGEWLNPRVKITTVYVANPSSVARAEKSAAFSESASIPGSPVM
jgi:hypothetical protein